MNLQLSHMARILSVLFVAFTMGVTQQVVGQSSVYGYGYLAIAQYGDAAEINIVNSDDPDRLVSSSPFPLPEGWTFSPRFRSIMSPDGRWIASTLFAADQSRLMIHLLNVDTWQSSQIIEGYISTNAQYIEWSPDSRYLAINIRQFDQHDFDLFVYDVVEGSMVDLSNDTADQRNVGWSLDSRHILTFSHPCNPNESCSDQLELYEVESATRRNTIDLAELPFLGTSACNPKMSPDVQNISVVSNCGIGVPFASDFPDEVYIWNLNSGELTQVTNYAQGQMGFLATYQHEWLDDQTLLIGVNYRIGNNPEEQQLATFQLESEALEILPIRVGAGFVLDRETGQIALQSRQFFVDHANGGEQIQLEFGSLSSLGEDDAATGTEIEAATIDIPSACESSWSPDGTLIAITMSGRDCTLYMEGITFVNPTTGTSIQHTIDDAQFASDTYYVVAGWIIQPNTTNQ